MRSQGIWVSFCGTTDSTYPHWFGFRPQPTYDQDENKGDITQEKDNESPDGIQQHLEHCLKIEKKKMKTWLIQNNPVEVQNQYEALSKEETDQGSRSWSSRPYMAATENKYSASGKANKVIMTKGLTRYGHTLP